MSRRRNSSAPVLNAADDDDDDDDDVSTDGETYFSYSSGFKRSSSQDGIISNFSLWNTIGRELFRWTEADGCKICALSYEHLQVFSCNHETNLNAFLPWWYIFFTSNLLLCVQTYLILSSTVYLLKILCFSIIFSFLNILKSAVSQT